MLNIISVEVKLVSVNVESGNSSSWCAFWCLDRISVKNSYLSGRLGAIDAASSYVVA